MKKTVIFAAAHKAAAELKTEYSDSAYHANFTLALCEIYTQLRTHSEYFEIGGTTYAAVADAAAELAQALTDIDELTKFVRKATRFELNRSAAIDMAEDSAAPVHARRLQAEMDELTQVTWERLLTVIDSRRHNDRPLSWHIFTAARYAVVKTWRSMFSHPTTGLTETVTDKDGNMTELFVVDTAATAAAERFQSPEAAAIYGETEAEIIRYSGIPAARAAAAIDYLKARNAVYGERCTAAAQQLKRDVDAVKRAAAVAYYATENNVTTAAARKAVATAEKEIRAIKTAAYIRQGLTKHAAAYRAGQEINSRTLIEYIKARDNG